MTSVLHHRCFLYKIFDRLEEIRIYRLHFIQKVFRNVEKKNRFGWKNVVFVSFWLFFQNPKEYEHGVYVRMENHTCIRKNSIGDKIYSIRIFSGIRGVLSTVNWGKPFCFSWVWVSILSYNWEEETISRTLFIFYVSVLWVIFSLSQEKRNIYFQIVSSVFFLILVFIIDAIV